MRRMCFVVLCMLLFGGVAFARVQGDDPSAPIAIEAELYSAIVPADTNEFAWDFYSDEEFEGYVYTGYMRALPDGINVGSDLARSPRLDYDVEMTQPGTYYIWARVLAPTSAQNSIHLGDSGVMTAERIDIPETEVWVWKNETNAGGRAMVEVNEPGVVTINCWMRESGACVDKLLLTMDPNYVPDGIEVMDPMAVRVQSVDDPNGLVAMEAELYAGIVPADTNEFEWVFNTEIDGFSLEGYMRTFPIETNVGSDLARSPRLDYDVAMTQTGTYYIWARVLAPTSAQNSIHLGDSGVMTAERLNIPDGGWVWVNETNDGGHAMLTVNADVNEPNLVTVDCWMRESGACVDKILLTMDPNYVPSSTGPRDPLVAGISLYVPMPIITAAPVEDMTFGVDDANNVILTSINGISTQDLILGTTLSERGVMDDFNLERDYDNDIDGVFITTFDVPVTQIFIVEKDGDDSGKLQPIDAGGNPIGDPLSFSPDNFSDSIDGVNAEGDDMSGTVITAEVPINGIEIWSSTLDPYSISAVPAPQAELAHKWTLDEADTAEGAVIADVVGGKDGVVVGTGVTSVLGVIDYACAFDGESHVSIADMDTTDLKQISVALWINPDVGYAIGTDGYKRVFSGGDNFEVILEPNTGQVGNNFYFSGGGYPLSNDPLPEGEWTHVAMTSELMSAGGSGLMTIYIDGALDVSMEAAADDDWSGGEMRIAHRPNSNPHFQGMLDDVRIYKGVLTSAQLEAAINGE